MVDKCEKLFIYYLLLDDLTNIISVLVWYFVLVTHIIIFI
jgi:hypothetical protein